MQKVTISERELEHFCTGVASLWDIDVSAYGKRQLHRRLKSMMRKNGVTRLDRLLKKMKRDPELAERLRIEFTINVSEFFRDIHLFDALEKFLRKAMQRRSIRTVWSAGCSYGAEAYSLAIILDELGADACTIVASDIDDRALQQARRGVFKESDLEHVSHVRRRRYFEEIRPEEYRIDKRLRRWVQFKNIDLLNPRGRQP
ncbi:MAG: CheR family methyltransferase, partial [Armatimonadota bacterium]